MTNLDEANKLLAKFEAELDGLRIDNDEAEKALITAETRSHETRALLTAGSSRYQAAKAMYDAILGQLIDPVPESAEASSHVRRNIRDEVLSVLAGGAIHTVDEIATRIGKVRPTQVLKALEKLAGKNRARNYVNHPDHPDGWGLPRPDLLTVTGAAVSPEGVKLDTQAGPGYDHVSGGADASA